MRNKEYYEVLRDRICFKGGKPYWKGTFRKDTIAGSVNKRGYREIGLRIAGIYKNIQAHRLNWFINHGDVPDILDHINRDKEDNRLENLRTCTTSQNGLNRCKTKKTSSKYLGVTWMKAKQRWYVRIQVNKRRHHVGYFKSEVEAAKAYNKAIMDLGIEEYSSRNDV